MNTKARYTLLLAQSLVTSLTVTKRDARFHRRMRVDVLLSSRYAAAAKPKPRHATPRYIAIERCNVCACLSLNALNKFPASDAIYASSSENCFARVHRSAIRHFRDSTCHYRGSPLARSVPSDFFFVLLVSATYRTLSAVRCASIGRCTVDARFVEKFLLDVRQRRAVMYAKSRKLVNARVRSG